MDVSVDVDLVVSSDLLLELNEFGEVASVVDGQEGLELVHEGLALSEIEAFFGVDLSSKELNKGKSDFVVLDTFDE